MARPLPSLLALVLGAAAALLVACGQDRSNLIPPENAQALKDRLTEVKAALDAGECTDISQLVEEARREAAKLPASVDRRLRQRINEGIQALEDEAPRDCTTPETQTETIPTVTVPAETTETQTDTTDEPTPTETTTTAPQPTETTTTPEPTQTAPPAETTPEPGTGGASPGDESSTP